MRGRPPVEKIAAALGLPNGRLISWSKSWYRELFPDHLVLSNASITDASGRRLWWGDLDASVDEEKLVALARALERRLFVFYEAHFRDPLPIERAALVFEPTGEVLMTDRVAPPPWPDRARRSRL
ncbi:MAG TPA: hypothetical protein VNW68_05480 [Candidatus Limnocylindria bacterium]|jgi:hypothetical protein|nr:hypothetical protein [Candidatus Limnocylindria bacterium]